MAKAQEKLQSDDHKSPFEKFDDLMSGLMQVSKEELDEALEEDKAEKVKKKAEKSKTKKK